MAVIYMNEGGRNWSGVRLKLRVFGTETCGKKKYTFFTTFFSRTSQATPLSVAQYPKICFLLQ